MLFGDAGQNDLCGGAYRDRIFVLRGLFRKMMTQKIENWAQLIKILSVIFFGSGLDEFGDLQKRPNCFLLVQGTHEQLLVKVRIRKHKSDHF